MKKSANALFMLLFVKNFQGIDKSELSAFKKDSQNFSQSLNISKNKNNKKSSKSDSSKDDLAVTKSLKGKSSKVKDDSDILNNKNSSLKDNKKEGSFFSSLFGSKKKEDNKKDLEIKLSKSKKNNKLNDSEYEDPFGGLDENLFDKKTKLKTAEKQEKTDARKINKKEGQEKKEKKDKEGGFFSSLGASIKSGAKSLVKSDLGKQVGGVLKDASVNVATNAIKAGADKLSDGVSTLNNKISGSEVQNDVKKEEISEVLNEKVQSSSNKDEEINIVDSIDSEIRDNEDSDVLEVKNIKDSNEFSKALDSKAEKVSPSIVNNNSYGPSFGSSSKSSKSSKKSKRKVKKNKKK